MGVAELAAIEFRLLGSVEAVREGSVLPLGGSKQRALLALLLLEPGEPVSTDRLIDELWHEQPPPGAETTLRSYVSRLRAILHVPIAGGPSGYALEIAPEHVDVARFKRLVAEGREALAGRLPNRALERIDAALELWRGRPFADVGDEGALRQEVERLEELRLLALEDRVEAELQLGAGGELVEELEALVAEHPYRERLWRQLMLALYRAERQADALEAYRRARRLLDETLGLEPGEELQALEQAILRHEVEPAAPPEQRHNLPAPLTSFVGRDTELAEIAALLDDTRLLTLTGVGGVGKTRLALQAAAQALRDFPDGVFFIDFSALADPALVPSYAARALGAAEQGATSIDDVLVARLRDAGLLLVLDNCEHVREACAALAYRLLTGCPQLRVLATSREFLGVPGEVDYAVPPLAASEAVDLFLIRARAARPRLADDDRAREAAAAICADLDDLPLAIELAAARAKALSLEEIAGRLGDRFRFLVSWRRLATARHRTLREAMDWSYELLSESERALLANLSIFMGGFTLAAAAAVALDGDKERAHDLVERLVQVSLVTPEERVGRMRYRLLETVRQFASEKLRETPTALDALSRTHGEFFATLVDDGDVRSGDEAQGHLIDDDLDNFRAAIERAAQRGDAETELRLVGGMWRYWSVRGYLREGRTRIDAALERRDGVRGRYLARALVGSAWLAMTQGDYQRAGMLAAEGLAEARARGGPVQEIAALNTLGVVAMRLRQYDVARRHLQQSHGVAVRHGLVDVLAAKLNLGLVELHSGRSEVAVPIFEELLATHSRSGRLHLGYGFASMHLGQALYQLDELERAQAAFAEARAAFDAIGFRAQFAHALQGLAAVEARAGSAETGARLLGEAAAVLEDVGASEDDFDVPGLVPAIETALRSRLGDDAFTSAYEEGRQETAAR